MKGGMSTRTTRATNRASAAPVTVSAPLRLSRARPESLPTLCSIASEMRALRAFAAPPRRRSVRRAARWRRTSRAGAFESSSRQLLISDLGPLFPHMPPAFRAMARCATADEMRRSACLMPSPRSDTKFPALRAGITDDARSPHDGPDSRPFDAMYSWTRCLVHRHRSPAKRPPLRSSAIMVADALRSC